MEEDNIARIDNRRARLQRLGALVNPETIKQYMFGTDVASSCPLSGLPDEPDNYHTVTISVTRDGSRIRLVLIQTGIRPQRRASTTKRTGRWCSPA